MEQTPESKALGPNDGGRVEVLPAGQDRLLEMTARGAPLGETLDALCKAIEREWPQCLASILLFDRQGDLMWCGAAPSLPESYRAAIDGRQANGYGPCGLAARGEEVVALASDPRWSPEYRELAQQHGLHACWSVPIKFSAGDVAGTTEICFRQPRDPTAEERAWLRPFIHLAGIAIERAQATTGNVIGDMVDAFRRSEERYARVVEAAHEGYWEWDMTTNEMFVSARMKELLGFPPDAHFASGTDFFARRPIHPDDRGFVNDAWQRAVSGSTPSYDLEYRVLPRPDEVRWVRSRVKVFYHEHGRPMRITGSFTDITDKKLAEEALRLSEHRYKLAIEAADQGHADWIVATDEFFASPRLLEICGLPPGATFSGRADFAERFPFHPEDRERVLLAIDALYAGRETRMEIDTRFLRGGETRWMRITFLCTRDESGKLVRASTANTDITDRKLAAEALMKSEARFRSLTELSADWYWEQDENHRFTYLSSGATKALAGPRAEYTVGPPIGKSRWEMPDVTALSCSWAEHQAVLAARQPFRDFEYRRQYPDGSTRYVSVSGEPIFDEQGRFKGYHGVARNITDRRLIEEELRARQDMLDLAQKAAHAAAFEWRISAGEGQNRWSTDLEALYGLAPGFYDGTFETWTQLVHPEDQPAANAAFERAKKTGDLVIEYRVRLQGGAVRWLQAKGRVVFDSDGKPERIVGFMIDVTERHKADDELQRSRHYLAEAQKLSHTGSWAFNAAGFGYWSPELFRIHGLDPSSKAPSIPKYLALVHPEDRDFVLQEIEKMLAGAERFDFTKRFVRPDGTIRLVRCVGIRANPGGIYPEFVGTGMDITEQERAEDELRGMEQKLRQAQRLEAMGTLAGGIAHDFNNLLGAILGYGEMALRNAPSGSRLRRDVESIMIAGERGRALVDRILAFSRSGIGERIPVHVEKVIRETLALFAAKLPGNIVLKKRLRSGRAAVLGDATQIHQVLMNLATNAVQAMPSGGSLQVSLDRVSVDARRSAAIGSIAAKEYVVLRVDDSGTGIAPEVLEKIFDPFFTTKEVGVGTGLGLSLVHGIVTGLGGAIDVETKVGKGSTFTVYLPTSGQVARAASTSKRSKSVASHGHRERILVIDDEESLVALVVDTLKDLGYVVDGFSSSVAALRAFDNDPARFDAVITDESMPGLSGSELIRKIRAQKPAVPILLLSGYLTAAVVQRALDAGADDVLRKPLSARDLGTSLARALQHSKRSSRTTASARSASRRSGSRPPQPSRASRRRGARR